jgi:hypothetical protein
VRSKYPADIRKGIILLEELYQNGNAEGRRDYLYYLAIANARIKVGVVMPITVQSVMTFFLNFVLFLLLYDFLSALLHSNLS